MGGVFFWDLFFLGGAVFFGGWGPGIEGRLDENHEKLPKIMKIIESDENDRKIIRHTENNEK